MTEALSKPIDVQPRFARLIFTVAGIWGVLIVLPLYFLESWINVQRPPAITHPEHYYGFIGVTLAWQFVYILIGRDPKRYRPVMILAMIAKSSYWLAVLVLFLFGRVTTEVFLISLPDLLLTILFAIAYASGESQNRGGLTPGSSRTRDLSYTFSVS